MPVEDRWIVRHGLRFHYRDWDGAGTPMLLLHGLASQSHIFDLVAPLLAMSFRVMALDQRGHGESVKPSAGYAMPSVAEDVRTMMDALKLKRAIIVGHSWGGNVAVQFGAQYPQRAAALVLVDGGFIDFQANPEMTWARTKEMLAPPKLNGMPVAQFKVMLKREAGAVWTPTIEQIVLQSFDILPVQTIRPRLSFEHHLKVLRGMWEQRPTRLYSHLRAPVLLIPARRKTDDAREQGFLTAKRRALDAAEEIPSPHETIWFDDTVHDIPLQRPRKLANAITRFARSHNL